MVASTDTTVVVVDTNVFLHYRPLDQLDWSALCSKDIELVVLPTVLKELEKVKAVGTSARLRTRAGQMSAWLSNLLDNGFNVQLKKGLRLRFETNEPTLDFAANNLVREVQDDILIAGLLTVAQASANLPFMATADVGVKMKAKVRGFPIFVPVESDKLADEPDPRDKELKELRKENEQFKNRQPRLSVYFPDNESRLQVVRTQAKPMPPTLADIKRQHPLICEPGESRSHGGVQLLALPILSMSKAARDSYNDRLRKFYCEYEKYSDKVITLRGLATCRLELSFTLENAGSAPATDIDVMIEFPENAKVFADEEFLSEPMIPDAPEIPNPYIVGHSLLATPTFRTPLLPSLFPQARKNWSLSTARNTAHFKLDRLKQGFQRTLPVIFLQFADDTEMKSSTISVVVSAAESLMPATQDLHLIIPNP